MPVAQMGLQHVVITSVDRDDLPNGGAEVFAACITEIRRRLPQTSVEVLIPDFKGSPEAYVSSSLLDPTFSITSRDDRPPVPYRAARRSLHARAGVLDRAKDMNPELLTKSGIICGLARTGTSCSLRCAIARRPGRYRPIGQYLRHPISTCHRALVHSRRIRGAEALWHALGIPALESGP